MKKIYQWIISLLQNVGCKFKNREEIKVPILGMTDDEILEDLKQYREDKKNLEELIFERPFENVNDIMLHTVLDIESIVNGNSEIINRQILSDSEKIQLIHKLIIKRQVKAMIFQDQKRTTT